MSLESWPLERLKPYDRNPRTHSPEQVDKIARSIREFGFTNPIIVDRDGTIIAGHGRLAAAKKLGLTEVPVIPLGHLTPMQKKALVIADNQLALDAGWDEELLSAELLVLEESGYDLDILGFDSKELDALLESPDDGDGPEEDAPEPQEIAVSRRGDIWLLDKHRVGCGDSTAEADVANLIATHRPRLMVTDPPYGVEYDPDWRNNANIEGRTIGATAVGKVENDDRADWSAAWKLFPGEIAYVWHAGKFSSVVQQSLEAVGFEMRAQIIWAKPRFVISRGNYHWQHEPCWYAVKKGATGNWQGDRSQTTLWSIEHQKSETGHGTQKPIEAMRRPIVNNSERNDAIYDPFLGSGTTLIAAEMTGRICIGMELSPNYVDVIVRRWEEQSGKQARLLVGGLTFAEIAKERAIQ